MDTTGTITNFTSTPNNVFSIGGDSYRVETAGQSYSLTNPDAQTLRFEIRPGDQWTADAGDAVDRADIDGSANQNAVIPAGTPINLNYQFMVEPNGPNGSFTNTASWFVTGQMHGADWVTGVWTSPTFALQLAGDHLQVVARYVSPGGNASNGSPDLHMMTLWTDPNPITTGQYYNISIQSNVSNTGGGYLHVSINGNQVVNYNGPLGYGYATYWEYGLYRKAGPSETVAADYRNLTLTTGSAATTPTTPTITPAVTQATASPTTGTEHVGDTVTLSLGFNEAVTVSGTPTLSLNDGGTATYVGGSGTGTLTFKTTVASTDTNTSALAITGVNLPSGASIKDSSGVAANLSGAVKTFTGLQIDPTTAPTTPTSPLPPSTPSVIAPVLTIADNSLWVAGRGGTVDLGAKVTTTDPNDRVTVNITGLPKYETITDKLDGQTFRGNNITLTAAQVDSGLTLQSNYKGNAHPVATLTLTASATDPTTGAVSTASSQTIAVTDPRPAATTTTTSTQPISVTDHPPAAAASTALLANQGFAGLHQHLDSVTSTLATTAPQPIILADHLPATGTTTASLASQSFALLNQYLAGNSGRVDPGQIVAAVSQAAGLGQEAFLARPHH